MSSTVTSSNSNSGGREKTLCLVCSVVSDNHHIHYGALACFSCRAFFRRAHNKSGGSSDPPNYICKHDGKCDITSKNRKKCQKCRYDKCIEIGMNPNLVLTDDQKKVRFRKMFEKKGSGAIEVSHGGNNGSKPVPVMSSSTTSRDSVMSCISRQIEAFNINAEITSAVKYSMTPRSNVPGPRPPRTGEEGEGGGRERGPRPRPQGRRF